MTNPYSAPSSQEASPRFKPRLLRTILLLNAAIIGVPLGLALTASLWSQLSIAWQAAISTGDPVAFQHFYSINASPWFVVAFFLIPNTILLATQGLWNRHNEPENRS